MNDLRRSVYGSGGVREAEFWHIEPPGRGDQVAIFLEDLIYRPRGVRRVPAQDLREPNNSVYAQ